MPVEDLVHERCKPKISPQLLQDGSWNLGDPPTASTMKDDYQPPIITHHETRGARQKKIEEEIWRQAQEEVMREITMPPHVEEYLTTYDCSYNVPEYQVKEVIEIDKELCERFPVYSSPAISFWTHAIESKPKDATAVPGLSKASSPNAPFKKSLSFTKPLNEVLDTEYR